VLLIDEGQITYQDSQFWLGQVKETNEGRCPGVRIVIFSSFGSFGAYGHTRMPGTPIKIDEKKVFRLYRLPDKPGMQLTRQEFDQMITGTIAQQVADRIWEMSSGHIGIAHAIIWFLVDQFKNKNVSIQLPDILRALDSADLVRVCSGRRGLPTLENFNLFLHKNNLAPGMQQIVRRFMNHVASGNELKFMDPTRSQESNEAVELLTREGFLHETEDGTLQFASQMHHTIWLESNRKDPDPGLLVNPLKIDFLIQSIKRMRASILAKFASMNTNGIVREQQLQMELYRATCTCVPKDVLITPEWHVSSTNGFIDMRISSPTVNWFWELLVNGDRAGEYASRFQGGGKYSPALTPETQCVLIDFRQEKGVRVQRDGFMYVSFTENYSTCTVSGLRQDDITFKLEG
jgi:hypothetical protein